MINNFRLLLLVGMVLLSSTLGYSYEIGDWVELDGQYFIVLMSRPAYANGFEQADLLHLAQPCIRAAGHAILGRGHLQLPGAS